MLNRLALCSSIVPFDDHYHHNSFLSLYILANVAFNATENTRVHMT